MNDSAKKSMEKIIELVENSIENSEDFILITESTAFTSINEEGSAFGKDQEQLKESKSGLAYNMGVVLSTLPSAEDSIELGRTLLSSLIAAYISTTVDIITEDTLDDLWEVKDLQIEDLLAYLALPILELDIVTAAFEVLDEPSLEIISNGLSRGLSLIVGEEVSPDEALGVLLSEEGFSTAVFQFALEKVNQNFSGDDEEEEETPDITKMN